MLTIFHVQNVLIILDWCLCDFLLLKHIDEVDALHLHLSFTAFDYLLMLTTFHVQNVLIILNWCSCDFLFLKHIDEVDALHFHLSLTYFFCGKYSRISILLLIIYWCWLFSMWKMFLSFLTDVYMILLYWNILIKWMPFIFIFYLLMLICCIILLLIICWCWLFFMCKMFLSLSTDVCVIFLFRNISIKWMHFIFICYLLMLICCITAFDNLMILTIFHVQNVLIILHWCLCDFFLPKHIDEVDALHLHLSLTYFYWCVEIILQLQLLLLTIYWCWIFFMCKMFLSFLTDVYMIFSVPKHINEVEALHLHLSLTYFLCGKYSTISILPLIIDWCWLFLMCKMFLLFLTDVYVIFSVPKHINEVEALHLHLSLTYFLCGKYSTISILLLIIYWCWLFFMCKMFLLFSTDVYVIFCVLKHIDEVGMHFIFICYLLMFTWFFVWKICLEF